MIILRQRVFSSPLPNYNYVEVLEEIADQSEELFPDCPEVFLSVIYTPNPAEPIQAQIHFGYEDQELVSVSMDSEGHLTDNFSQTGLNTAELRGQLFKAIDQLQRERIPGTEEKLEFFRAQIVSLR